MNDKEGRHGHPATSPVLPHVHTAALRTHCCTAQTLLYSADAAALHRCCCTVLTPLHCAVYGTCSGTAALRRSPSAYLVRLLGNLFWNTTPRLLLRSYSLPALQLKWDCASSKAPGLSNACASPCWTNLPPLLLLGMNLRILQPISISFAK
eukprot:scaffold60197_cov21-Tisochrysis_lutea.AAC.2